MASDREFKQTSNSEERFSERPSIDTDNSPSRWISPPTFPGSLPPLLSSLSVKVQTSAPDPTSAHRESRRTLEMLDSQLEGASAKGELGAPNFTDGYQS